MPRVGTAIEAIGPRSRDLPAVRAALRSANRSVRFWAARAVVKLGPAGESAIPELLDLLCDSDHAVADSVIWALASIGEPAIAPLCKAAADGRIDLRRRALIAIGRYPQHVSSKLPPILAALDDPNAAVRGAAGSAVCSLLQAFDRRADLSAGEADAVATLRRALDRIAADPDIEVDRAWVARLVGWFCNDE